MQSDLNENLLFFWESPPYKCNAGLAMRKAKLARQEATGIKVSFSQWKARLFPNAP
jgi:hypothetical protein